MEWQPLDPRARRLFYLQSFSRLLFFWVPMTAAGAAALAMWWSLTGAMVVAAVWLFVQLVAAIWMPALAYDRWSYAVREDGDLLVAHGVIVRQVEALPLPRVQHVDLAQGPLEQWMGLARLQVFTASGMGSDAQIPGLDLAVAQALRDRLLRVGGDDGV